MVLTGRSGADGAEAEEEVAELGALVFDPLEMGGRILSFSEEIEVETEIEDIAGEALRG